MKEIEYLRQNGTLITDKQYKSILIKIIFIFIISAFICLGGMTIMLLSESRYLLFVGLSIFLFGSFLLIFDAFYLITKYAAKVQLYRRYKKFPEEFEAEITEKKLDI